MSPTVSIVMPCFNGAQWLGESIESVLSQDEVEIEVIVVNDGSGDNSGDLVNRYTRVDNRVRLIEQPRSGVSRARNIGTARARGQFLQYLDVDDVLEPATIAARVNALRSSNSDIACCRWQWWERDPMARFKAVQLSAVDSVRI